MDEKAQEARRKEIGRRANRLMRAGWYEREDVIWLRDSIKKGMVLMELEWTLEIAERAARDAGIVLTEMEPA